MAPSLGCGGLFRRQSSSSSDPSKAEWRRKSVKLREGTFLHGELQVDIQESNDERTTEGDRIFVSPPSIFIYGILVWDSVPGTRGEGTSRLINLVESQFIW